MKICTQTRVKGQNPQILTRPCGRILKFHALGGTPDVSFMSEFFDQHHRCTTEEILTGPCEGFFRFALMMRKIYVWRTTAG